MYMYAMWQFYTNRAVCGFGVVGVGGEILQTVAFKFRNIIFVPTSTSRTGGGHPSKTACTHLFADYGILFTLLFAYSTVGRSVKQRI